MASDVVVLGAGVSGLTAAYQLQQLGHRVTVLEAKPHAGGLSQTARDGTTVTERADDGSLVTQTACLDEGMSINLGPGRLPHHHRRILGLCRDLGVELAPYIMSSDANYYADTRTGNRWRRRRIEHDARGYVAEAAYQARGLDRAEREMATHLGDLNPAGRYVGSQRAGPDGKPLPRGDLARLRFWRSMFWQPCSYLWQDSMFEPVGGMDAIWRALLAIVRGRVVFNAPAREVRTSSAGVWVTYQHRGQTRTDRFDWCLSSVPLPHLAEMRLRGFNTEYRDAVDTPAFAEACKVGWQANKRWWESDGEQIYGGISYTNHVINQFWYPSHGFGTGKGTLTGAYNAYGKARRFGRGTPQDRINTARDGGSLIHPEVEDEEIVPDRHAVTVAWHKVPYQAGGWCHWEPGDPEHADAWTRLQTPDGRFLTIGDQVSEWPGWQEGAVAAAQRGVDAVEGTITRYVPTRDAPDSRWLTMGDHPDEDDPDESGSPLEAA